MQQPPGWGPPPPYGQPVYQQQPYQQQPPYPPQGYGQQPYPPQGYGQMPVAKVGVFDKIPCPYCGSLTTSHAPGAGAAQFAGGLVGWLIVSAFATKHYCGSHGEIPKAQFPPEHQSSMTTRMLIKLGIGGAILFLVFGLIAVSAVLGH